MEPKYKGPFVVTEVSKEFGTCRLETIEGQRLDSLNHKDRLKHAVGDKPNYSWYNPTVSRREVKAVTSTRSGRGGDGAHVMARSTMVPVV